MSILKNEIPILEFDTDAMAVIDPKTKGLTKWSSLFAVMIC